MKRNNLIAIVLIAVVALSIISVAGVTTAPKAGAKYLTNIVFACPINTAVANTREGNRVGVSGRLMYKHYVTQRGLQDMPLNFGTPSNVPQEVFTGVPNRWVTLLCKFCVTRPDANWKYYCVCTPPGKSWADLVSLAHWSYWTKVRTDAKGYFYSPARVMPKVTPQPRAAYTFTTKAFFPGDATFGPSQSIACDTRYAG